MNCSDSLMAQTRSAGGIFSLDFVVYCKIRGFTYATGGKMSFETNGTCAGALFLFLFLFSYNHDKAQPQADSASRLKPDINSPSQIPGGRWAWRHKSKYFRSQSLLASTPADHPPPKLPQHHKPAICHKVIIELSIGKQLTPFFSFFLLANPSPPPLPHLQPLIWTAIEKESEVGGGGLASN